MLTSCPAAHKLLMIYGPIKWVPPMIRMRIAGSFLVSQLVLVATRYTLWAEKTRGKLCSQHSFPAVHDVSNGSVNNILALRKPRQLTCECRVATRTPL